MMAAPETQEAAVVAYREARDLYLRAAAAEDAAFVRWFEKRQAGEPTNGGAAQRLANRANELSADLAVAQGRLYEHDLDPADVDRADGVERTILY